MSDKLVELVNLWHAFEKENPKAEIQDFCKSYLLGKDTIIPPEQSFTEDNPKGKVLGRALSRIYKMSIFYSKKNLIELELKTLEDFVYLRNLTELGPLTKKQLIDMHISEYTTGIEIIKRLINLGLVKEKINPEDKRSTSILTTAKGKAVLEKCYPYMLQIGSTVYDPLSDKETQQLAYLLTKLDTIHTNIYQNHRDSSMEELQKIVKAIGK
jgi:DNA-binding MarR family transcriptional regulator